MLTHKQVWNAIDTIAERYGYSASGLAKRSGLDPTSFNPSKRNGPDGRPRWPTMESISRLLQASGATVEEFSDLLTGRRGQPRSGNTGPRDGPRLDVQFAVGGCDSASINAGPGRSRSSARHIQSRGRRHAHTRRHAAGGSSGVDRWHRIGVDRHVAAGGGHVAASNRRFDFVVDFVLG